MKKIHIVALILVFTAIAVVISTISDSSTYVDFDTASQYPEREFTVIGNLDKDAEMDYDARKNRFQFTAIDKNGNSQKVLYFQPKPQDFERAEDITMKGFATDSGFVAREILLKCPSKYNEQNQVAEN